MTKRVDFELPIDAELSFCRSCKAPIAWIVTAAGKRMPLSLADTEEREGKKYAISHFVDCPQSRAWRKKS